MTKLYHFTSFAAACKIIESGRMRFGKQYRMNDLLESNKIAFGHVLSKEIMKQYNEFYAEDEMHRYQQISFTQDRDYNDLSFLGFDLHTMWGLYADRGAGVCLVLDKEKLALKEGDYAKNVEYYDLIPTNYGFHNKSKTGIRSEIWRRRDEIFFLKRKEWEYEQEYRIIRRANDERDDEYLDISKALSFVIICKDYSVDGFESIWDGDYYQDLKYLNRKLPVLSYENGLDGFTLWPDDGDPIWAEQLGYL
jgi:hypothetical protein